MDIKVSDYTQIGYVTNEKGYIIKCQLFDYEIYIGRNVCSGNELLLSLNHKRLDDTIIKDVASQFGFNLIKTE